MFSNPTIADFEILLEDHRRSAVDFLGTTIRQIYADHSKRGLLRSGLTIRRSISEMDSALEAGVSAMLAELRRWVTTTTLDKNELRAITVNHLQAFVSDLPEASSLRKAEKWVASKSVSEIIEQAFSKLKDTMQVRLRQFDIGVEQPATADGPSPMASNIVHADTIYGLQQGTSGSSQQVWVSLNVKTIEAAVSQIEGALPAEASSVELDSIRADLDTIKAQLKKPSPDGSIIREAARTIRNVTEGVVGGLLTPGAIEGIAILSAAVGLG